MNVYKEFAELYLPDLVNYVVAILDGANQISSGVLISVCGRHFVATARHCIESDRLRVSRSDGRLQQNRITGERSLRIINKGWHDRLDIGYLETDTPECGELEWIQLCSDRIIGGMIHVVGYPLTLVQLDQHKREMSLCAGAFGTTLIEETDDYLKFDYPKHGAKFEENSGAWVSSPFPETPKGFSGGACFGVVHDNDGRLGVVEYKLLGIQCSWHPAERWVKVIPIKRWCDLMSAHGHCR